MLRPLVAILALSLTAAGVALALVAPGADDAVTRVFAQRTGAWELGRVARDVTALGSHAVVLALMLATAVVLALGRRARPAAATLALGLGAVALNAMIKAVVQRPRPDLGVVLEVASTSFPSGHALLAAAAWPWLGTLIAARETAAPARIGLVALGLGLAALVAASRLALGMHRPSEVLAGLGIGLGWGWLCARWARRPVGAGRL